MLYVVRVYLFSVRNENDNEFKRYSAKYLMIQYVLAKKRDIVIVNYGVLTLLVFQFNQLYSNRRRKSLAVSLVMCYETTTLICINIYDSL
jgi:hypothetical protein